jgi:hypothetical protein
VIGPPLEAERVDQPGGPLGGDRDGMQRVPIGRERDCRVHIEYRQFRGRQRDFEKVKEHIAARGALVSDGNGMCTCREFSEGAANQYILERPFQVD